MLQAFILMNQDVLNSASNQVYNQDTDPTSHHYYPSTAYNHPGSSAYEIATDYSSGGLAEWGTDMWYLPPGAAFFQNTDQAITQTADGVNVGGHDLLDFMTMDIGQGFDGVGMGF